MLGFGDQRHDVVQEGALGLDDLADFLEVLVVDPGDQHRVDLHQDAALDQHLQAFLLALDEDLRRLHAADALVVPVDPRVDLGADLRVHAVDGDGHVVDVVLGQLVHAVRQRQAIGGNAQLDVRRLLAEHAEGLEGALRVGQGIAGTGDAEHGHLRDGRRHRLDLPHRLQRVEHFGDHAGARLVGAVVLAVAVVALDVAGRRHRHVHAGEVVVGFFRVAGVVVHLLADMFRQLGKLIVRAAAGSRGATASTVLLRIVLPKYAQFHGRSPGKRKSPETEQSPCPIIKLLF
ncbi:hypothetical protein D3C78_514000 [compost metagenome]